ncbi:hypothetical protein KSC_017320 [Ktedonobacter sp. SOSP1-52]|nr:hypothetical protein KSC_017320 [Ktedonobacter sp. SOSP1-52]
MFLDSASLSLVNQQTAGKEEGDPESTRVLSEDLQRKTTIVYCQSKNAAFSQGIDPCERDTG